MVCAEQYVGGEDAEEEVRGSRQEVGIFVEEYQQSEEVGELAADVAQHGPCRTVGAQNSSGPPWASTSADVAAALAFRYSPSTGTGSGRIPSTRVGV